MSDTAEGDGGRQSSRPVVEYARPVNEAFPNPVARFSLYCGVSQLAWLVLIAGSAALDPRGWLGRFLDAVLGLAWIVAALLAIVLGAIGQRRARTPGVVGGRQAGLGIVLGTLGLLVLTINGAGNYIVLHMYGRQGSVLRERCGRNLQGLGQAITDYAARHGGRYPASLEQLCIESGADPRELICPASDDTPASDGSPAELAAALKTSGHCSYIYLGRGLHTVIPGTTVIAYEPLGNHQNGTHLLHADGSVLWLDGQLAIQVIAGLTNAPPTTQPTGSPASTNR